MVLYIKNGSKASRFSRRIVDNLSSGLHFNPFRTKKVTVWVYRYKVYEGLALRFAKVLCLQPGLQPHILRPSSWFYFLRRGQYVVGTDLLVFQEVQP